MFVDDNDLQHVHQQSRRSINQRDQESIRWASSIGCYGRSSLFFSKSSDRRGRTANSTNSRRLADVQRGFDNHSGTGRTIYKSSESRCSGRYRGCALYSTSGAHAEFRQTSREKPNQLEHRVVFERSCRRDALLGARNHGGGTWLRNATS